MFPSSPRRDIRDGRPVWIFEDGHVLPVISGGDGPDDEKKFTQADLERIIGERLARQPKVETETKVPDDYQATKDELAALKAEKLSESDRLRAELAAATQRAETAEAERDTAFAERDTVKGESREEKIRSAIVTAAVQAKAIDPEDVLLNVLAKHKDSVTIGDDGQVTGVEDAMKALLEAKPHLVGTPRKPAPDRGMGAQSDPESSTSKGRDLYRERHPVKG